MVCWSIPVYPCLCLRQKLHFPPRYDCFGKEKQGRTCLAAEADQTAHPDKSQCPHGCAMLPPCPGSCSLCSSTESQVVRGSVVTSTQDIPFPTSWLALREGDESSLCKGHAAANSILHPATRPHLAPAQGAALLTDTASSGATLPAADWGLQGCLLVPQCLEWHSSQNPSSGRRGAMAEVSPDPPINS